MPLNLKNTIQKYYGSFDNYYQIILGKLQSGDLTLFNWNKPKKDSDNFLDKARIQIKPEKRKTLFGKILNIKSEDKTKSIKFKTMA